MSKKLKPYQVRVSYTFNGIVDVRAESKKEAVNIVNQGFGGINIEVGNSSWDSTNEDEKGIVDWGINMKPERTHIW